MREDAKLLITGGAGFIGSHLADALLGMKSHVIAYDNLDDYYPKKKGNVQHNLGNPAYAFVAEDILRYETLLEYVEGVDVVFHLAAQPGVDFSVKNPEKTLTINVLGTLNVLEAAKKARVKRVVFASSSSVYGSPKYRPLDEDHPTVPISTYGASKLAAENLCRVYNDQSDLEVVILRYHTVYGPRQRPDMAISRWARQMFHKKPITIYGDGSQTRDFTYVEDVISGTIRASEVGGIGGEVFNIGRGRSVTITETIDVLAETMGMDIDMAYEPSRKGDVKATHADTRKAQQVLEFEPQVQLEEGLARFVRWFRKVVMPGG